MPQRHPTYYFQGGNCVILLSDSQVLYRLHREYLQLDMGCFRTLLSLMPADPQEGFDDSHPIVIPLLSVKDFDHFLDYVLRHQLRYGDEAALIAVLNLGHFFELECAQRDARAALERHPDFRAALKLALGIKNTLTDWIEDGFRELVTRPLRSLQPSDIELIGLRAYHVLANTQEAIEEHRKVVAFHCPAIRHAPSCPFDLQCKLGWEREWWSKVAKWLLHPEQAKPGTEIQVMLEETELNDVTPDCKALTMEVVRDKGALTREIRIVEDALRSLLP